MSVPPTYQAQTKVRKTFTQQPDCIYQVKGLKSIDKLIWQYLNTHKKGFNPSIGMICENCDCSRQTTIASINRLEEKGLLKVTRQTRGLSNLYTTSLNQALLKTKHQSKLGTTTSLNQALPVVPNLDPKNNKENNKENNNVIQPVDNVDNFKPLLSKSDFNNIFEFINQIHGRNNNNVSQRIAKYYIRLLSKNEVGTIELIGKYCQAVKIGSQFHKTIRLRGKHPIFDAAFKRQFEKDLKNEELR